MAEHRVLEAARLLAALEPEVAERLQAGHPPEGRYSACGTPSPCSIRQFADLVIRETGRSAATSS